MIKKLNYLAFFLLISLLSTAQTGSIQGKVTDKSTGETIPFATVILMDSSNQTLKGSTTDFDGNYTIKPVSPGIYNLKVNYIGYTQCLVKNVKVNNSKVTLMNIEMKAETTTLDAVEIVSYSQPLIHRDASSQDVIMSRSVQCVPGIVIQGSRGKRRVKTITGGTPARYGDVTGGVVNINRNNPNFNTESYGKIKENEFLDSKSNPLSTFSIDVDRASYANVRRYLEGNSLPPKDAVRIEEMINYFNYDYPQPTGDHPFSITLEGSKCPWNKDHQLVMVGLKGKTLESESTPASNLTFLIDVSGSMQSYNKLTLVKKSLLILVNNLKPNDKVSIVVYAGAAGLVLPPTSGANKNTIINAINGLEAGGSTAGGAGIELAYKTAKENYIDGGNNRVILATDGDFNVGVSDNGSLVRLIEEKRKDGIFLTILGFGMGNYKDDKMEELSNAGNGNYAYIDNAREAKKMFGQELAGTLYTIAKDVKIQIEFNPAKVKAYRLIGYENRLLDAKDFNDDKKDAGEIGAGHSVTAFYEIIPAGSDEEIIKADTLKYQNTKVVNSDDLMTVKFRYKAPNGISSKLITQSITEEDILNGEVSENFMFASLVAEFGMLLTDSKFKEKASFAHIEKTGVKYIGEDEYGYRLEFLRLVKIAKQLKKETSYKTD